MATYINVTVGPKSLLQQDQDNRAAQRLTKQLVDESKSDTEERAKQSDEENKQGSALEALKTGKKLTATRRPEKGGLVELELPGRQVVPGTLETASAGWTGYYTRIARDLTLNKLILSVQPYEGSNYYTKADVFWGPSLHQNGKIVPTSRLSIPDVYFQLSWTSRQKSHISATFDTSWLKPGTSIPAMRDGNPSPFPYSYSEIKATHDTFLHSRDNQFVRPSNPASRQDYRVLSNVSAVFGGKVYHWQLITEMTPLGDFLSQDGFDDQGYKISDPYVALDSDYRLALRNKRYLFTNDPDYALSDSDPGALMPLLASQRFLNFYGYQNSQRIKWFCLEWSCDLKTGAATYTRTDLTQWDLFSPPLLNNDLGNELSTRGESAFDQFWRTVMSAPNPYRALYFDHLSRSPGYSGYTFSRINGYYATAYDSWPQTLNYDPTTGKAVITCTQTASSSVWVKLEKQFSGGMDAVALRATLPYGVLPKDYTEAILVANGWTTKGPLKTRLTSELVFAPII